MGVRGISGGGVMVMMLCWHLTLIVVGSGGAR